MDCGWAVGWHMEDEFGWLKYHGGFHNYGAVFGHCRLHEEPRMAMLNQAALKDVAGEHNDVFAETYAERGCGILVTYLHVRHMVCLARFFYRFGKTEGGMCQTSPDSF